MRTVERDPIVIFSLNLGQLETAQAVSAALPDRRIEPVQGCFEGVKEWSVIVPAAVWDANAAELAKLLHSHGQKCIMFADGQRNAWLCNGPTYDTAQAAERKYLGELVSRPTRQLTKLPASYTQVLENTHYVR